MPVTSTTVPWIKTNIASSYPALSQVLGSTQERFDHGQLRSLSQNVYGFPGVT